MKRKLIALILMALLVVSLAACKVKDKDKTDGNVNDNGGTNNDVGENNGGTNTDPAPIEKGVIFSPDLEVRIIKAKDAKELDVDSIFETYYLCTGSFPEVRSDNEDKIPHEIVIGDSNRDITAKAKAALESGFPKIVRDWEDRGLDTTFLIGYAIYSDGESIAVVWSDESAQKYAFEYFIENYFHNPTLELEDGYVNVKGIDRIEALREEEAVEREAVYAKIAEEYRAFQWNLQHNLPGRYPW